jgi:hypothetical protein
MDTGMGGNLMASFKAAIVTWIDPELPDDKHYATYTECEDIQRVIANTYRYTGYVVIDIEFK